MDSIERRIADLNVEAIKARVAEVRQHADDGYDHSAHESMDTLRDDFIRHVAQRGDDRLRAMAEGVLTTDEIEFERWYS